MKHYELVVMDFFSGEVVGVYGGFDTMKQVKDEMLDIECLLGSSIVFGYRVGTFGKTFGRLLTKPELLEIGQAKMAERETVAI